MSGFNYILLKTVRLAMGYSQKDFAEKILGVKQAVLSKYENGVIVPSEEGLVKLATATGYPSDFFFQDGTELPSGLVFHRKRNSLSAKLREQIESEVRLRAMDIQTICFEKKLTSDVIERENRSPSEMAQALRKYWQIEGKPIENMIELMESRNIVILKFDFNTDKLDAFFMPLPSGVICIALNSNKGFSADRQHFSLAHELGHALLHKEQAPDDKIEKEADEFAAEFLFPANEAELDLKPNLTFALLKELKAKWKISMQAILYRGHKLNLIEDNIYRRFYIYFSSQGYRKNEPPCGVEFENPNLLDNLMQWYAQNYKDLLNRLHLSKEIFLRRYPNLPMEVLSPMT